MGNRNSGIAGNSGSGVGYLGGLHALNLVSTTLSKQSGSGSGTGTLERELHNTQIKARQSTHLNSKSNIKKKDRQTRDLEEGLRKHSEWRLEKLRNHRDRKKMLRSFYELKGDKAESKRLKRKSGRRLLDADMTGSTCLRSFDANTKKTEVKLISAETAQLCSIVMNKRNSTNDIFELKISPFKKSPFTISILPPGNLLTFRNNTGAVIDSKTANSIAPIEVLENKITVKFNGYNITAIKENNQWSVGFYTNANLTAINQDCIFKESIYAQSPIQASSAMQASSAIQASSALSVSSPFIPQLPNTTLQKICNSTDNGLITKEFAIINGTVDLSYTPSFINEFESDNKTYFNYSFNSFKIEIKDGSLKFLNISNFQPLLSFDSQGNNNPAFNGYDLNITQNTSSSKKYQVRNNLGEIINLEFSFNEGSLNEIKMLDSSGDGYLLNITGASLAQAKIVTNAVINNNVSATCQAIDYLHTQVPVSASSIPVVNTSNSSSGSFPFSGFGSTQFSGVGSTQFSGVGSTQLSGVGSTQLSGVGSTQFSGVGSNNSLSRSSFAGPSGSFSFSGLGSTPLVIKPNITISKEGNNKLVLSINSKEIASVQFNQREELKDFKFNLTINNKTIELSIPQSSQIEEQIQSLNQQILRSSLSSLNFTNSNGNISLSFTTPDLRDVNLIINKNSINKRFNLAFYKDANPLDNFQGITEQEFIQAEGLIECSKNFNKGFNRTEVVASKDNAKISSFTIPSRIDQSSHYNVSLTIIGRAPITISINPVNNEVKITNFSGRVINNPGISVLGGIYPINKDLNLSISLDNGLYSCAYVDSRNLKIDDNCLTSENSFPPKPNSCKIHSSGFVIGNDLVTDFNASNNAVYVKDFNAFLSAKDGKISLKKGNGEVLFTFNNSQLESNGLGRNLTKIDESNYKLLDNQGNQLSLLFLVNNNQPSLKLLKANGDGVQYNLTRDSDRETYNIAGIVANQVITECSASQFINFPTTSTTTAQATTSTTTAQATTSTTSARATTAQPRQIQRSCNQTTTDQHVQQNFYNDGNLFFRINASKNASVSKNTSISFAIGESKIDFSFNPSQTIKEITIFFIRNFNLKNVTVDENLIMNGENQAIISFTNINPANTSLIITKNSGNITYQLAVNGTIINQCNLLTTNIVEQIPEIIPTTSLTSFSTPIAILPPPSSSIVYPTTTPKANNSCEARNNTVVQKTNGEDQFEVSKNGDLIEFRFIESNQTLSFDNSTLMVDSLPQLFPYNFTDNNFNYTVTNSLNNLRIIRNDGLEILINKTGVVVSSDRGYIDAQICKFENTKDQTSTITIFDTTASRITTSTTTSGITTSTTPNGITSTTFEPVTSQQIINATFLCLENDYDNIKSFTSFIDYLKNTDSNYPNKLINITSARFNHVVDELKKPFKDDNEILGILKGINTSHCNRTDFIERIQKIDDILKAKENQGGGRFNILPIVIPLAILGGFGLWFATAKNPVKKIRDFGRNLINSNSAQVTQNVSSRGDLVFRPYPIESSSDLVIVGRNFGNPNFLDLENQYPELGLSRRERGGLSGSLLRTLTGLLCLSNANGFHVAKQNSDLHGNILQTKNLFSLSLIPSQITSQGLNQGVLQDIARSDSAPNFAPKGGFKFENDGFKFEFDQTSKNFILKDSSGNLKARCDKSGEIIDRDKSGIPKNPKLKLSKFGNMNVRYSRDDGNKKMTMLDENKNGFQITFIGENILSSVVEEGRILSENFNGIYIEHLSNKAKDFTFQDQKVLKTIILDDKFVIENNFGSAIEFPFNNERTGFDLANLAEVINTFNERNEDGFKFTLPTAESPNKIAFKIDGQDFYILVDQQTKQFSFYDSMDNKLESSSNKIIADEQSLISITQDKKDFEIAFDKNDVSIYSLINSLITSSNNQDFATRITKVSSDKLDVEEGYKLNPEIINKFLDSIYELSGKDSIIASYVESMKLILNDDHSSNNNIAMILQTFANMNAYLKDNKFNLASLFDKTQQFFIEKNQAEIRAEILRQNQHYSQRELIYIQMQQSFSPHLALSRPFEFSSDLASSAQVEEQIDDSKRKYVSVAKSRIASKRKEEKYANSAIRDDPEDSQYSDTKYSSEEDLFLDDKFISEHESSKNGNKSLGKISDDEFEDEISDDEFLDLQNETLPDEEDKYRSYLQAFLLNDKNHLITSSIYEEREQQLAELERKIPDLISKIKRLDLFRKQQLKYVYERLENGVEALNWQEESRKSYFKSLKINRVQDKLLSQFNLIVGSILKENPNSRFAIEARRYIDNIRADKDLDNKHPFFVNASLVQRNKIKGLVDRKVSQDKISRRQSAVQERKWGRLSEKALEAKSGDQLTEPNGLQVNQAQGKALSKVQSASNSKG